MIFIDRTEAIQLLYASKTDEITESIILELLDCVDNGFTEENLSTFFTKEIVQKLIEDNFNPKLLNEPLTLEVEYKADEYLFNVTVDTLLDVRDEDTRIMLGASIGEVIKDKIDNHGEIISFKKV